MNGLVADSNVLRALAARRSRWLLWHRRFLLFSRWNALALSLLLVGLVLARYWTWPLWPLGVVAALWLLAVAAFVVLRADLAPPPWQALAWLDRHGGARGRLMAGSPDLSAPVCEATAKLVFPRLSWWRPLSLWLALSLGLWAAWSVQPQAMQAAPLEGKSRPTQLIERLQQRVQALKRLDQQAEQRQWLEQAAQALSELAQQPRLSRQDLDDLARLDQALSQSSSASAMPPMEKSPMQPSSMQPSGQGQPEDLSALASPLLNNPSAMAQLLQQMAQAAGENGESSLQQALDQASKAASQGQFSPQDLQALQRQIEQQRAARQGLGASPGASTSGEEQDGEGAGVSQGPGEAEHEGGILFERDGARFDAQGFVANPDDQTVLLGTSLMRQSEAATVDQESGAQAVSPAMSDQWYKRSLPRHRRAIRDYFDGQDVRPLP